MPALWETASDRPPEVKRPGPGLHKCYACKKPFTVRIGTIFEDSHLPLHLWLQVIHLFCAQKKGIATRQIQRMLNCSMKTAWFLGHRIRLGHGPRTATGPMGGAGKTVETDEIEMGRSRKTRRPSPAPQRQRQGSQPRGTRRPDPIYVRSTIAATARGIDATLTSDSRLVTDGAPALQIHVARQAREPSITRNSNGYAATFTRIRWKAFSSVLKARPDWRLSARRSKAPSTAIWPNLISDRNTRAKLGY